MDLSSTYISQAVKNISELFREQRPTLLSEFGKAAYTLKSNKTIVTVLDGELEDKLRGLLTRLDSSVGIIGEERGSTGNKEVYWLLDPIDGTQQFVRGMPGCVNVACLVFDDQPQVSIIYDFVNDELFTAIKGQGALLNGKPTRVSSRPLAESWVEFGFRSNQPEVVPALSELMQACSVMRTRNTTLINKGCVDGMVVMNGKGGLWDYGPRVLMVQEAGGRAANFGSDRYDMHNTSFIASNPVIFDQLQSIFAGFA